MAKGAVLPKNWQPSRDEIIYGIDLGFSEARVLELAEDMRLWAVGNSNRAVARKANWHTTFLGWMRRERDRVRRFNQPRPHEQTYAELEEELRGGYESGRSEADLFGPEFTGPGNTRHH